MAVLNDGGTASLAKSEPGLQLPDEHGIFTTASYCGFPHMYEAIWLANAMLPA